MNIDTVGKKVMEYSNLLMVHTMMASSREIHSMEKASLCGETNDHILEIGLIIKCRVMGFSLGQTGSDMKVAT